MYNSQNMQRTGFASLSSDTILTVAPFLLHKVLSRPLHLSSCTRHNPGRFCSLLYMPENPADSNVSVFLKIFYNNGANNRSTDCIARIKIFRFLQNSRVISWDFAIVSRASSFSCITAWERYRKTPHSKCRYRLR